MLEDKKIFLATQHDASIDEPKPNEIYSVGAIVNIVQSLKLPDGNIKVLVEGVERAKVVSVSDEEGFFRAVVLPGLALQRITTREPSDDQLEVAIHALREALALDSIRARESQAAA